MGKGSGRRPGEGYESNWERIFSTQELIFKGKPKEEPKLSLEQQNEMLRAEVNRLKEVIEDLRHGSY